MEYLGLQLAPAHGAELGLFVGDLQRPDRVPAQGFEFGFGMRVEAHCLLRIVDPPGLPVRCGCASPPRVVFAQDRGCIRAGWCPEMAGQPRLGVLECSFAEAIRAADAAGFTAEAIGRSFGLSRVTVTRILRRENRGARAESDRFGSRPPLRGGGL